MAAAPPRRGDLLGRSEPSVRDEAQFARRLSRFAITMGLGCLAQRKSVVDIQLEPTFPHEREATVGALSHLVGNPGSPSGTSRIVNVKVRADPFLHLLVPRVP
jgi:hypothetical protein